MFTVIISVLATVVAVSVGFYLCMSLNKRRRKIVVEALITNLNKYPQRTFKNGKREYLVTFLPGNLNYGDDRPNSQLSVWKELSNEWGIFCKMDISTIEKLIEWNPTITVLNIPTESPSEKICGGMYKIIRVK